MDVSEVLISMIMKNKMKKPVDRLSLKRLETKMSRTMLRRWKLTEKRDETMALLAEMMPVYQHHILAKMPVEQKQKRRDDKIFDDAEEAVAWWAETYFIPRLKAKKIYDLRYRGRPLTDEEKRWMEIYESKVER